LLQEDVFISKFIYASFSDVCVAKIELKRKNNFIILNIFVPKSTSVVGTDGSRIYDLRNQLSKLLKLNFVERNITMNIVEIINSETNSKVLADFIRQQLERRIPFRRVMKGAIMKAQKAGVKGIKVQLAGRLNGAEIARTEWIREGQVPLHTLRANIDYFNHKALLIWIIFLVLVSLFLF
jgi:small subunit ribosomal protein S3